MGDASPLRWRSPAAARPPEVACICRICSITCVHRGSLPLCLVTLLATVAAWTPSKPANLQIRPFPQRASGSLGTSPHGPRRRGLTAGTRSVAEGSRWALPFGLVWTGAHQGRHQKPSRGGTSAGAARALGLKAAGPPARLACAGSGGPWCFSSDRLKTFLCSGFRSEGCVLLLG